MASNRSYLFEINFGTEHKRGIWTLQSLHLSTQQREAHGKGYTTALPNTGIYDINASTNKCTSGVQGRSKNNVPEYNHYYFPAKKEETPQRFILGARFLYIFSPYFCLHNK